MIFLMLFSYVILCDFFPLYDFVTGKCLPSIEDQSDTRISLTKIVRKRSIINETKLAKDPQTDFGFQHHSRPSINEMILVFWIFTLFCEEIRQVK